jgi:cobyrinic acid a,c-diamide synthase
VSSPGGARIVVAGTHSGVGKSLFVIGLVHELRRRQVSVSCCVTGPNLIQANILKRISGRYVRALDHKLLSAGQNLTALVQAGVGSDIVVIEGKGGLFDGYAPGSFRGSDAEMASLTKTPAVLVTDVRGVGNSITANLSGFVSLCQEFEIIGPLLNRLEEVRAADDDDDDLRDQEFYDACLQAGGVPASVGFLPELALDTALPRVPFGQDSNQVTLSRQFFLDLGQAVNQYVDIDYILEAAAQAAPLAAPDPDEISGGRRVRIAVSDDSCFNLCFQDNLALLQMYGAEIVPFSPLADTSLPKRVGGVYLTGAYLKDYGAELTVNNSMRTALRDFAEQGGVIYAEGGGAAFLCSEFRFPEEDLVYEGIGIIEGSARYHPPSLFHNEAVTIDESIFGRSGLIIKGVSSGEWEIRNDMNIPKVLRFAETRAGLRHGGYSPDAQVLATFEFCHFGSNPEVAQNLVEAAEVVQPIAGA